MLTEPIAATMEVVRVLDDLGVPYFVGGSLASSVRGVARATLDADLIAALRQEHVSSLVARLSGEFYVDEPAVRRAVAEGSTFNLIHLSSMFKIDVFVSKGRPFEQAEFARRTLQLLSDEPREEAYVASTEDIILAKLEWFRRGGEVSDRQWRDVVGIAQVHETSLDLGYLRLWAGRLQVSDLVERALQEVRDSAVGQD